MGKFILTAIEKPKYRQHHNTTQTKNLIINLINHLFKMMLNGISPDFEGGS